jgi:TadE-like protein
MAGPKRGSVTVEFALTYAALILPVTLGLIYIAQLLWMWHSVNEFTREGASYASTHCWESSAGNVLSFMRANVPPMINQDQFQNGPAQISVNYFAYDQTAGALAPFSCNGDCSVGCIPDTVTVSVSNFSFSNFITYLGLPAVPLPNFQTSLPVEGAGCDPEQGVCLP